jgi:DNA-binding transcriptional ArsR family regulator
MNVVDEAVAPIAAAIGEPARTRMLYCLIDGRARTSTELAVLAGVTPSTASAHLGRLEAVRLVNVTAQGKHRYYRLDRPEVAAALEALTVIAGHVPQPHDRPRTPPALRIARSCYDHLAGALGVALFDRWTALDWIVTTTRAGSCDLTPLGRTRLEAWGIDVDAAYAARRQFAFACVDWSERRPHLAGALGAAVLHRLLGQKWVVRDLDSRVLRLTALGRREMASRFGVTL